VSLSFVISSVYMFFFFFFSSRRRHTSSKRDWSSDVCSSDLHVPPARHHLAVPPTIPGHPRDRQAALRTELLSLVDDAHARIDQRSEERRVGKEGRSRWEAVPLIGKSLWDLYAIKMKERYE